MKPAPLKVAVYGMGRMGKLVSELLCAQSFQSPTLSFAQGFDRSSDLKALLTYDAVIDFSTPDASRSLQQWLISHQTALPPHFCYVSGVTGYGNTAMTKTTITPEIEELKRYIRVFYASNFSIGILFLNQVVKQASAFLSDFDVEIFELHHKQKKDSPSGTALTLAQSMASQRTDGHILCHQENQYPKNKNEIHVSAGRGGQIIGEHMVYLIGESERIELIHRAQNRALFASGAIKALHWLTQKEIGLYGMDDLWQSFDQDQQGSKPLTMISDQYGQS